MSVENVDGNVAEELEDIKMDTEASLDEYREDESEDGFHFINDILEKSQRLVV